MLPTPAPSSQPICTRFIAALPASLGPAAARLTTSVTSPYVAEYGAKAHPIVVRCGVGTPVGFTPSSSLISIDNGTGEVGWFETSSGGRETFTTALRPTRVEVSVPSHGYEIDVAIGTVTRTVGSRTPAGADATSAGS